MKIAFLSPIDPRDINFWSGTPYFMLDALEKDHDVEWIGGDLLQKIPVYQARPGTRSRMSYPEEFAQEFGQDLSARLEEGAYDVAITLDKSLGAYLDTTIPLVFISDTTFKGFKHFLSNPSSAFIELSERIERELVDNADLLVYSSEWAKSSAVNDCGADPENVAVVEFGANLSDIPAYLPRTPSEHEPCRLVFIGRNWSAKGGDKVYQAYRILRSQGFDCSLTVIGSVPKGCDESDKRLRVIPFIDKSDPSDSDLLHTILRHAHFLVLPTTFDCFGIVFCEASAYGVPSIASRVGGVSQVVRDGENGFLLPPDAAAGEYAALIRQIYDDKETYARLRDLSRTAFEKRLNWDVWRVKINKLLEKLVADNAENPRCKKRDSFYIPAYIINLPERTERRAHMESQFQGREEFELVWVEACRHEKGTVGLWESIRKAVRMAEERDDQVMILCEDDHYFTEHYDKGKLIDHITEAYKQRAELVIGGVGGFGCALPVGPSRYWIDWYWSNQFLILYRSAYRKILDYRFEDTDTADGVLSEILTNKLAIHPFISRQKSFGYSDVTLDNNRNSEYIDYYFIAADEKFRRIKQAYDHFYPDPVF